MKRVTRKIIGSILLSIPFIVMIVLCGLSVGWFMALVFWGSIFGAAGLIIFGCSLLA
jgi:hypothetical protein